MLGTDWLGFDPSHGIFTDHTHLAIASVAITEKTIPAHSQYTRLFYYCR
jgi:hypothetical protein